MENKKSELVMSTVYLLPEVKSALVAQYGSLTKGLKHLYEVNKKINEKKLK